MFTCHHKLAVGTVDDADGIVERFELFKQVLHPRDAEVDANHTLQFARTFKHTIRVRQVVGHILLHQIYHLIGIVQFK